MATERHNGYPSQLAAGDSLTFSLSTPTGTTPRSVVYFCGYDSEMHFEVEGAVDPNDSTSWLYTITPDLTGALPPGRYAVSCVVTDENNGDRSSFNGGWLKLTPNLELPPAKSPAAQQLALVRAEIQRRLEKGTLEGHSSAAGNSVSKTPLEQLHQLEKYYESKVKQESGQLGRKIYYQFG